MKKNQNKSVTQSLLTSKVINNK